MTYKYIPETPEGPKALSEAHPVLPHPHCPSPSPLSLPPSVPVPESPPSRGHLGTFSDLLTHSTALGPALSCTIDNLCVFICLVDASSLQGRPQGGGKPSLLTRHAAPKQCLAHNGFSKNTE